jgi:hydroxylamine dehydrogenase
MMVFAWLTGLEVGTTAIAAPQSCLECHATLSPTAVTAWRESRHGRRDVGCADCHGEDHSTIFARKGRVSAAVCGKCHSKEKTQFDLSLHAAAMDNLQSDPKFNRLSPVLKELGCVGCHQIGDRSDDGSRGRCNSCHSSHSFSVAEARRPEACATCHTGPDHPHFAMWQASKHGQLFAVPETRNQSPTCVTCHMAKGNHHTGIGLSLGQVSSGATLEGTVPPVKMRTISASEAARQRKAMVETCLPCHSSRFASESLLQADTAKKEADALLGEAVELIAGLEADGLLVRPGTNSTSAHGVVLGPEQPYDGLSPAEQRFFDLSKFHHASTFKGAYHHSPEFTHNQGFLRMKQDLTFLRSEADRLRALRPAATNRNVRPVLSFP